MNNEETTQKIYLIARLKAIKSHKFQSKSGMKATGDGEKANGNKKTRYCLPFFQRDPHISREKKKDR